jgi:hypothetical protein
MATETISTWRTAVEYHAKDVDNETTVLDYATVHCLRDFCRETNLWHEDLADISIVANTSEYTLTLPTTNGDAVELVHLSKVLYKENGADDDQYTPLSPKTRKWLDQWYPHWEYSTSTAPSMFLVKPNNVLRLIDIPTVASTDGILAHAVMMPAIGATTVWDFFYKKYEEAIALGAASILMGMASKRWYDKELAGLLWVEYEEHKYNAHQSNDLNFTAPQDLVAVPDWGASGGSRGGSVTGWGAYPGAGI